MYVRTHASMHACTHTYMYIYIYALVVRSANIYWTVELHIKYFCCDVFTQNNIKVLPCSTCLTKVKGTGLHCNKVCTTKIYTQGYLQ